VLGRGRGHHHLASLVTVLTDQDARERLHLVDEHVGSALTRFGRRIDRPTSRQPRRLSRQHHRGTVLPHQVEDAEDQVLARDRAVRQQAHLAQRGGDGRTAGAGEQRPVEIEERRGRTS
jgi:hypothetical protein